MKIRSTLFQSLSPKFFAKGEIKQQASLTQDLAAKDDVWNLDEMQASKRRKILENRKKNYIWSTAKKLADDERQVSIAMRQVALDISQNPDSSKLLLPYS
eukprot:15333133-Ditylum_brightwellii.AAC.1